MVKKIIILGEINKKYLLPLCLAIYQIINKIFTTYYPRLPTNTVFDRYSSSLAFMLIIFLPCIFKLKIKEEQREKELHKRKWLHFLIMIILAFGYSLMKILVISLKLSYVESQKLSPQVVNPFAEGPFVYICLEMVLLTVASIILLKYKYFIHHTISIVGFFIFGNISDIVLRYYPTIIKYGALANIMQILSIVVDVIYYYYQKYMMEKLFYPYWTINFTIGIAFFILATTSLIYVLIKGKETYPTFINGENFYKYFENEKVGLKIGKQILLLIFSIIGATLNILNIYYFNPNYILISFQFSKMIDVLTKEEDYAKFYFIIFFIFQLFFLMIYLEILEFNFCNLNKNTKKNIDLRSIEESTAIGSRNFSVTSGIIDINKDYCINEPESEDKNDKNIELLEQNDDEAISPSL